MISSKVGSSLVWPLEYFPLRRYKQTVSYPFLVFLCCQSSMCEMWATGWGKWSFLFILIGCQSSKERVFGQDGEILTHVYVIQSWQNICCEGVLVSSTTFKGLFSFDKPEPTKLLPQDSRCCSPQPPDQHMPRTIPLVAGGKGSVKENFTDRKMESATLECRENSFIISSN